MAQQNSALLLLKKVGKELLLREEELERMTHAESFIDFDITIQDDDGDFCAFKGFHCEHNSVLGPTFGGLIFEDGLDEERIRGEAIESMLKCALLEIPFGGAAAGVNLDSKKLSETELEKVSREFAILISQFLSSENNILCSDFGTNEKVIDWMFEEVSKIKGKKEAELCFTNKSLKNNGIHVQNISFGFGVMCLLKDILSSIGLNLSLAKIGIQGFGHVGSSIANVLDEAEGKVSILSDSTATIYCEEGCFDTKEILLQKTKGKSFIEMTEYKVVSDPKNIFAAECDVLILAASHSKITLETAKVIKAKVIIEFAKNSIDYNAKLFLESQGVIIIPNLLAASTILLLNYFEHTQNVNDEHWTEEQVRKQVSDKINSIITRILSITSERKIYFEDACYQKAILDLSKKIKY